MELRRVRFRLIRKKTPAFKKRQYIIQEGEEKKGKYFFYQGGIKEFKKYGTPKIRNLRFARTGDILGYRGLATEPIYPISATAVTPAELCFIPADFLETLLQTNVSFTYQLLRVYATELHKAEKRMRDLVHRDVKSRIALALQD